MAFSTFVSFETLILYIWLTVLVTVYFPVLFLSIPVFVIFHVITYLVHYVDSVSVISTCLERAWWSQHALNSCDKVCYLDVTGRADVITE